MWFINLDTLIFFHEMATWRSVTTVTKFGPLLTTNPPHVDTYEGIPLPL